MCAIIIATIIFGMLKIMKNPFKFGTIVEKPFFTNRSKETEQIKRLLESNNHLILISPRRYGKTSLINNVVKSTERPVITLDLQLISNVEDFASQLLKRIYKEFKTAKIKELIQHFRIIPTLSLNPITNSVDVTFQPSFKEITLLEDVLNLLEKLSERKRAILVLDEFQDIKRISPTLERTLRSIMQYHKNINYILLGSLEAMMKEIFEKKNSPFYHFGLVLYLQKISFDDFKKFLIDSFKPLKNNSNSLANRILSISACHPYYTQQLSYIVWEILIKNIAEENPVEKAFEQLVQNHDLDYERLWNTLNQTDKLVLINLVLSNLSPLSKEFFQKNSIASSTVFSSLKRLTQQGFLIKNNMNYEIEDPFFKKWIIKRRNGE